MKENQNTINNAFDDAQGLSGELQLFSQSTPLQIFKALVVFFIYFYTLYTYSTSLIPLYTPLYPLNACTRRYAPMRSYRSYDLS